MRYITETQADSLLRLLEEIGNVLNGIIEQAPRFCQQRSMEVREDAASYAAIADDDRFTDYYSLITDYYSLHPHGFHRFPERHTAQS
ncbi:MAG TPA: hypothetical protein PLZ36_05715 [Armatimonadota bacterium]|nr:hypothetical protein [Armatimonadota bacterium]